MEETEELTQWKKVVQKLTERSKYLIYFIKFGGGGGGGSQGAPTSVRNPAHN